MRISPGFLTRRRKGLAGLIAAMFVFAMIFTAGLGYFLYENQLSLTASQAAANNQASNLQAQQEHLGLAAYLVKSGPNTNWLALQAYNSGGISSIMTAVFVTNPAGKMLSNSTSTHTPYLVGKNDLNVTLPISLGIGQNTTSMTGCGTNPGCSMAINIAAFKYVSGTVFLNVLTKFGNVFSIPYPSGSTTTTVTTTSGSSSTTVTTGSTTTVTSGSSTTLTTSGTLGVGFGIGTNSLVVTMRACPGTSPFTTNCGQGTNVYQGGEVVLKINVTNFAAVAMNVYVNVQSVGTNGASVTISGPSACTGGVTNTQLVAADTGTPVTVTYVCTYSGNTGPTGGTVTFIGYAVGTYTIAPAPPVTITSAETTSNPLPMGNQASSVTGPWVMNYFSFQYASTQHPTWAPGEIVSSGSNSKVVFRVQVTNTANASLTVLQYTYFQIVRTSQEMDYYLISPVTSYPASISPYVCTNGGSGGAPSGSNCTPVQTNCTVLGNGCVPVGSSITLNFAACAPGGASASWMWANTGGGNGACSSNNASFAPPEGVVGFVVIVYGYYNAGKWNTFSQTLPTEGIYISP